MRWRPREVQAWLGNPNLKPAATSWHQLMFTLHPSPFTLHHSPFTIHHSHPHPVVRYAEGKARSKVGNAVRRGKAAHEYDDSVDGDGDMPTK